MLEDRAHAYLQDVLALDPQVQADTILQKRRDFLDPDEIITAQVSDTDEFDLRTRMQQRLNELRRDFWAMKSSVREQRIESLVKIANPETAAAAARLRSVAACANDISQLRTDRFADHRFIDIFLKILIAPTAEANRLREREYRWMRPPAESAMYQSARAAIQGTARLLQRQYPAVYALEETWLAELLEYDPKHETKNENADVALGCGMLLAGPLVIYLIVKIFIWIL